MARLIFINHTEDAVNEYVKLEDDLKSWRDGLTWFAAGAIVMTLFTGGLAAPFSTIFLLALVAVYHWRKHVVTKTYWMEVERYFEKLPESERSDERRKFDEAKYAEQMRRSGKGIW